MKRITLREVLEREKKKLDLLNMEVARFRVEHGFSTPMKLLYGAMGKLNERLVDLSTGVTMLESEWARIEGRLSILKEKTDEDSSS